MKYVIFIFSFICISFTTVGQNSTVVGNVIDATNNQPLLGATIIQKGTQNGVTSDFDGNFTLEGVSINDIIIISYVGFQDAEIKLTTLNSISVTLKIDTATLDEVIVVGYGTQRKKEITGAVAVISAETIKELKPVRIEQALQGQVAGVQVTPASGAPGSGVDIKIRGISTNGDNKPLILLDGNVIEDLSVINPADIESINVLKDATAGIYGVRAANGVILITTKNGSYESDLKLDVKSYYGVQETTNQISVLNATEYALLVNEARTNGGQSPLFTNIGDLGEGTNWQEEVFESPPIYNADLTLSGGTKNSRSSFGMSYLSQDGIVGGDKANFNRFTTRISHDRKILKKIEFNSSIIYSGTVRKTISENAIGSVLYNAVNNAPTFSVLDENGSFTLADGLGNEVINPLAQLDNTNNKTRVRKLSGAFSANYSFLENFKVESRIQANYAEVIGYNYSPVAFYGAGKVFNISQNSDVVNETANIFRDYTFDAFANYKNTLNEVHNVDVTLGTSIFQTTGRFVTLTGINVRGKDNRVSSAATIFDSRDNGSGTFDSRLLSYFARLQYDYQGKYLFSAILRRDGSTKFGPENKFGNFYAFSGGWILSEENLLQQSKNISFLKLRASYGKLGNDRIGDFRFESSLNGEGAYVFDDDLIIGSAIGGLSNPTIKWENQFTFDVGFDAKFFDNKLDLTVDYFNKRTEDLLLQPQVSGILGGAAPGSSSPVVNAGTIVNKGLEFSLGYRNTVSENFKYNLSVNTTLLDNEVTEVNGENTFIAGGTFGIGQEPPSRMEVGQTIGYFRGYKTNGIFQTQDEVDNHALQTNASPGDIRFVDINGDGVINDDDKTNIGDPIADVTFGLNIGFTYKNFDFIAYTFASIGNDVVRDYQRNQQLTNNSILSLDRWTGAGTSNEVPRVTTGATQNTQFSDFYVEDGSFARIQNVTLGYTFSDSFLSSYQVDSVRLYASVNNLYTFTNYSGYDPTTTSGAPIGGGIDIGYYPSPRTYLFGLNFNF